MHPKLLYWEADTLYILDQTKLPVEVVYFPCDSVKDVWDAIKTLKVRGAPAIGIAGAFGIALGVRKVNLSNVEEFIEYAKRIGEELASARPTAVNLQWAIDRIIKVVEENSSAGVEKLKELLYAEAQRILEEDIAVCRKIGEVGSSLIKDGDNILTHCNAGGLATGGFGTALGVIYKAKEEGKQIHVYVDETRPVLQGARLTAWELMYAGVECTLICDNMAATLMKQGRIDVVIVGADRIAKNGDTANKIGTYNLACLCKIHKIPFYIAAPISTFDFSIEDGTRIPIEERPGEEVTCIWGVRIAPANVKVYNPAFDVTPNSYITGFITERGFYKPEELSKLYI